ncbi:hypothetical protein O6H91_20G071400 [Diphasiastrum complanatum]|uniref:Uncharacterized protein n=1 Tax=Diphasiastrum complanatum TaxID=34168 RepID=A0ACC2ARN0_DIPCM|nr:hypothetical protein O6H91_20G071400 [Diphasiastrum complanatum]
MVNLMIRLSKAANTSKEAAATSGGGGGGGGRAGDGANLAAPISSRPPPCVDHLDVEELAFAKVVGTPPVNATVNILGRKWQRKLGHKDPCEHVFCLTCAKKDPICFLCEERIVRIQKLEVLEGIYICGAPGCLRSFLKRPEIETHIKDTHKGLLGKLGERDEKAEAQFQAQSHPVQILTVQGQFGPPSPAHPLHPQQPRQPQPQSSEDKPVRGQAKQNPSVSSGFQREEKQSRSHQSKTSSHQQDRHAHQKQQQHVQHQEQHQHAHTSQIKSLQNPHDNHQQRDHHHHQHAHQQLQQHHGQQEKQHRTSHSEKQQQQQPEKQHQHQHRPQHRSPQNQQGMPPPSFPAQSFPSPYHTQQDENFLQQPRYDSPRFGPFLDPRMPVHAGVLDYQEKPRPRHSGHAAMEREGGLLSSGHQDGFLPMERQPPMPHYHGEFGPRGPQVMGVGMDCPPHFKKCHMVTCLQHPKGVNMD